MNETEGGSKGRCFFPFVVVVMCLSSPPLVLFNTHICPPAHNPHHAGSLFPSPSPLWLRCVLCTRRD